MWVELILSVLMIGLGIVLIVGVNHVRNSLPLQIMQWPKLLLSDYSLIF